MEQSGEGVFLEWNRIFDRIRYTTHGEEYILFACSENIGRFLKKYSEKNKYADRSFNKIVHNN